MELEYKEFNVKVSNVKQDGDKGTATILLSPYNNIDDGGDRVLPSCGTLNDKKKVPLLKQHAMGTEHGHLFLYNSQEGIKGDITLYLEKTAEGIPVFQEAYKHYALLKRAESDGIPVKYSIGYQTLDYAYTTVNKQQVRDLKSINIMEGSRVTFPMNPLAQNVPGSVKSQNITTAENEELENKGITGSTTLPLADSKTKWDGSAATKRVLDKYTDKKGNISSDAKKAFFYVDTSKPNENGSYKFGFADIINDTLTAIPAGILACANALRGARASSTLNLDIKKGIAKKVNIYLKKLKYAEIQESEIKEGENILETKTNETQTEQKAMSFTDLLKVQQANDMRWKLQDALNSSFRQLMNDENMAIEDKLKQLETNVNDFAKAYTEAMKLLLQASAKSKTAKKEIEQTLETKSNENQLETKDDKEPQETKAGKKISKANGDKLSQCKDALTGAATLIASLLEDDSSDDDPDDGDDDENKSKKKPTTSQQKKPKDGEGTPQDDGKDPNKQEKSNGSNLELKSEEISELKKIEKLFKVKENKGDEI